MSRPGIKPGPLQWEASTLEKSHSNSLLMAIWNIYIWACENRKVQLYMNTKLRWWSRKKKRGKNCILQTKVNHDKARAFVPCNGRACVGTPALLPICTQFGQHTRRHLCTEKNLMRTLKIKYLNTENVNYGNRLFCFRETGSIVGQ